MDQVPFSIGKYSESLFDWPSTLNGATLGPGWEIHLPWQKLRNTSPFPPGPDTHVHLLTYPDMDLCADVHAYVHRRVCSHGHACTQMLVRRCPHSRREIAGYSCSPGSTLPAAFR